MNSQTGPRLPNPATKEQPEITPVMQLICCFIETYSQRCGFPPSFREIAAWVGLKKPNQVSYYVGRLETWGYLTQELYHCRSVVLTEAGKAIAARWQLEIVA